MYPRYYSLVVDYAQLDDCQCLVGCNAAAPSHLSLLNSAAKSALCERGPADAGLAKHRHCPAILDEWRDRGLCAISCSHNWPGSGQHPSLPQVSCQSIHVLTTIESQMSSLSNLSSGVDCRNIIQLCIQWPSCTLCT